MSAITHWLVTTLHVWRHTLTADGSGGYTESWVDQGAENFKVDESTAAERAVAAQDEAKHTHNIYGEPDVDVQRNDRLAAAGVNVNTPASGVVWYEVASTTTPSTPRYLKCAAERVEHG